MQKNLVQDGADFAEIACKTFDADPSSSSRLSTTTEGPAYLLGMDELLAIRSDVHHRETFFHSTGNVRSRP